VLLCAGDEGVRLIQAVFVRVFKWIESTGSKPVVGGLIILAVAVSIAISMWSSTGQPLLLCDGKGRLWGCAWDPGALYSNAIQNTLQLIVLFATIGLAYAIKEQHASSHTNLHEKIDKLRKVVDSLAEEDDREAD